MTKINNRKNSTYLIIGIGAIFIVLILFNQLAQNPTNYEMKLQKARQDKNLMLKNNPQGPIPEEDRPFFKRLRYYPINENYAIYAILEAPLRPDTIQLATSDGKVQYLELAGKVQFDWQNKPYRLTAFKYLDKELPNTLFVPFTDETSAIETYGAGRYLDIPHNPNQELIIDFNTAYNPYCAYNESFTCPLPPRENHLDFEVKAGEMKYGGG